MIDRLLNTARRTSRILVWMGGALIIISAFLITLSIILRKLFNISFAGADELSGYAFGIATSFSFAYALFERAHIRVDALYNLFPAWMKIFANFLGMFLLTSFVAVICLMAWNLVADTLVYNSHSITPLRTPLAIPQIPWLTGWIFFLFCSVLLILAALKALISKNISAVNRLIGTKTLGKQINDEKV